MALNYDTISAIVKKKYLPILSDNFFNSSYLFKQMRARPDMIDGGTSLMVPLLYAGGAGGGYIEHGVLDVTPKEKITAAEYQWKYIYASMNISQQQELKASGAEAVLNLIQTETEAAEKTLFDTASTALYNDGSDSELPHGLRKIIDSGRTLGGIDSSSYSWWDAVVASDVDSNFTTTNLTEANMTNPSSDYYILTVMRKVWSRTIHNGEHPDGIYMSEGMFNLFEHVLQPFAEFNYQPTQAVKMAAEAGFETLGWKGIPVIYDEYCPDGFIFMTNSKYLNMKIHKDDNFKLGPWQKPVNKQERIAIITATMQFVTRNSRYLGRIEANSAIG